MNEELRQFLGDDVVVTDHEFRVMAGNMSRPTLHRLDKKGEGPPKIQLSARRVGRRLGDVRAWLQSRRRS
jgi:predicted DNA-binding transcriptional regulator AlpA